MKTTLMKSKTVFRALAAFAGFALASVAHAQFVFRVQVDTSSLVGNPAGPFSLDFQLNDGLGIGDGNNWATLSHFQFGGGAAVPGAMTWGGAWGSLASGITLTDTDPLVNEFLQGFTPGSWLSFDLTLSNHVDVGGTPDIFSFAILDGNLMNLQTHALGSDSFLEINLAGPTPTIAAFASLDNAIAAPRVTPVPEPSTYALWLSVVLGVAVSARRYSRRVAE